MAVGKSTSLRRGVKLMAGCPRNHPGTLEVRVQSSDPSTSMTLGTKCHFFLYFSGCIGCILDFVLEEWRNKKVSNLLGFPGKISPLQRQPMCISHPTVDASEILHHPPYGCIRHYKTPVNNARTTTVPSTS